MTNYKKKKIISNRYFNICCCCFLHIFPSKFNRRASQTFDDHKSSYPTSQKHYRNKKYRESIALSTIETANNNDEIEKESIITKKKDNGSSLALNYYPNESGILEENINCQLNTITFDLPTKSNSARPIKKRQTWLY